VAECAVWTGSVMTDDRPLPQYGEYATPEQQAAAMGRHYVAPLPPQPVAPVVPAPQPVAPEDRLQVPGHRIDRFATIFQLGIAIAVLINSDYFHLSENVNPTFTEVGIPLQLPASIDQLGGLLLAVNVVALAGTMVWAYWTLRRGRLAFYIPFLGYLAFAIFLGVVLALNR
jgi:Family of unknown function (DUF6264)